MLGDFMVKNAKLGREICTYLNRFSRNEMLCGVVNHKHMGHICEKGFLDSNFN